MRLFSEERKHKTDQALLTAPISLVGLVLGKFFAAVCIFLAGLGITLVYGLVISFVAVPNWALILGNFVALALLGMALIAIGMFISSLTENQVVAAVGAFAIGLLLLLMDSLGSLITNSVFAAIVNGLSFNRHYARFTTGIFDLTGVVFFFCVSAVFVFLTVRVQEKRRWN
jgi:ABC-2 type transport system permease protein